MLPKVRRLLIALVLAVAALSLSVLPAAADGPCCYSMSGAGYQAGEPRSQLEFPPSPAGRNLR
jgi:hypothetical protein